MSLCRSVALLAIIGIGIRIYGRRARLLVMQEGLLILQAPIIFAAAMLCFSIAESIVIAEQAKAAREARPLTPAGAFGVGAGWIFAYVHGPLRSIPFVDMSERYRYLAMCAFPRVSGPRLLIF